MDRIDAQLVDGRRVAGPEQLVRLTTFGLLERQSSGESDVVWRLYPWRRVEHVDLKIEDIDKALDQALFL